MPSPADAAPSLIFAPELASVGSSLDLSSEESHYVSRVCRARVGDRLRATDGRGTQATLRVLSVGARVRAEIATRRTIERDRCAWLLCGTPEGQRADWLVEKLMELGIARFQPIDCAAGRFRVSPARHERWQRLAIAALRQSQRFHLMAIEAPIALEAALDALPPDGRRWVADADAPKAAQRPPEAGLSVAAVGPSPGFTSAEREQLQRAGFEPISLGDSRLRSETAALAWAAWWARS